MKFRIICEIPQFQISERHEVDTQEEFDDKVAEIKFIINDSIIGYDLFEETSVYNIISGCPGNLTEELYAEVKELFNSMKNKTISGELVDDQHKVLEKFEIYSIDDWIEDVQYSEQSTIHSIDIAFRALNRFLDDGYWQAALTDNQGNIYTDSNKWSFIKNENDNVIWSVDGKQLNPIVWFGLEDRINEDCWTIRAHKDPMNINEEFIDHLAIRWESEDLNWSILIGADGDYICNWIAEVGIDDIEITNKAIEAFENCPIEIVEGDDFNSIEKKLNRHLILLVNQR